MIAYRSAVLSALDETENALVAYSEEQARREHLERAVKSNEESVRLSTELYKAGLTDFPSVLDAQRALYEDEDLLAQSRTAQTVSLIALYKFWVADGNHPSAVKVAKDRRRSQPDTCLGHCTQPACSLSKGAILARHTYRRASKADKSRAEGESRCNLLF